MFKKGARVIGVAWCCFVSMVPSFFAVHAADRVKVNIGWEYKDIEAKVELYEVKNRSRLWETKSVKLINLAPIGDKIESSVLLLEPGQSKRFVLVMRNETEKPLFFFAAPHVAHPVEHSLGFKFRCLCINHAFTIGPNETWYRIVELRLANGFVGREFSVTHSVIRIDQSRAKLFAKEPVLPDLGF